MNRAANPTFMSPSASHDEVGELKRRVKKLEEAVAALQAVSYSFVVHYNRACLTSSCLLVLPRLFLPPRSCLFIIAPPLFVSPAAVTTAFGLYFMQRAERKNNT